MAKANCKNRKDAGRNPKPCPFCGDQPKIIIDEQEGYCSAWVGCHECGVSFFGIGFIDHDKSPKKSAKKRALRQWNRREGEKR